MTTICFGKPYTKRRARKRQTTTNGIRVTVGAWSNKHPPETERSIEKTRDVRYRGNSNEADAINEEVENNNYDLVVKYTKDEEKLTSLIFTPIDWQLLRKCPIPVLMVRDGDWKHQRRILVAVNVSGEQEYQDEFNQELVETGISLAENLNRGNVHLVAAYPSAPINMAIDLPEFNTSGYENGIRGQHLINMKALRQKFGIDEDHTHVREGFPEEVIPEVAKEIEAELVILGTVGRTGLSAALLGNTAEHVISKLSCNLLGIKPSKKMIKTFS